MPLMGQFLNPLLSILDVNTNDRIISIRENGNIDSNFVQTHLIKQIFNNNDKICFVLLHNTLGHYCSIGKKLGYDLSRKISENNAKILEPLQGIIEDLSRNFLENQEDFMKSLFADIKTNLDSLSRNNSNNIYLIIDDLSHLLDLGVNLNLIIIFINYFTNLINERIYLIINNHTCNKTDEIISFNLNYLSDINIEVLPIKTGVINDVTGVIHVQKRGQMRKTYHYKAYDKGIKTFHPGETLYNLYK